MPITSEARSLMRCSVHGNARSAASTGGHPRCWALEHGVRVNRARHPPCMKSSLNPTWLRRLVVRCGFLDAYAEADPHTDAFAQTIASRLDEASRELWDSLRAELDSASN